jgi:hypothetical protein
MSYKINHKQFDLSSNYLNSKLFIVTTVDGINFNKTKIVDGVADFNVTFNYLYLKNMGDFFEVNLVLSCDDEPSCDLNKLKNSYDSSDFNLTMNYNRTTYTNMNYFPLEYYTYRSILNRVEISYKLTKNVNETYRIISRVDKEYGLERLTTNFNKDLKGEVIDDNEGNKVVILNSNFISIDPSSMVSTKITYKKIQQVGAEVWAAYGLTKSIMDVISGFINEYFLKILIMSNIFRIEPIPQYSYKNLSAKNAFAENDVRGKVKIYQCCKNGKKRDRIPESIDYLF